VSRKTLSSIRNGRAGNSPEIAIRLSIAFETFARSRLSESFQARPAGSPAGCRGNPRDTRSAHRVNSPKMRRSGGTGLGENPGHRPGPQYGHTDRGQSLRIRFPPLSLPFLVEPASRGHFRGRRLPSSSLLPSDIILKTLLKILVGIAEVTVGGVIVSVLQIAFRGFQRLVGTESNRQAGSLDLPGSQLNQIDQIAEVAPTAVRLLAVLLGS
jgi:hypothetical protein